MLLGSFLGVNINEHINMPFQGKSDTFWKAYKNKLGGIPLKDIIIRSIDNNANFLGEGLSKKGYNFEGLKNYVIRVYKNSFRKEDLEKTFVKPVKNWVNRLEEVVLCIPGKIDIVKKKNGKSLGVENYAERIQINDFPPLRNVHVTREETLNSLELYKQLKDFPIDSFKSAYLQIRKFSSKPGFQFDIISPNNILIDTTRKKINLIDPVTPEVNSPVHGEAEDFSKYQGCDSLYPILCDFIMQREHLNNLSEPEKARWEDAMRHIIAKSIYAGRIAGYDSNIDKMKVLYNRIGNFWGTKELPKRYEDFIKYYKEVIDLAQTIDDALNYKNKEQLRIRAIKQLNTSDFNDIKPVFEKILEAPHQPKVEFPEIINAVLDKIMEYGDQAKTIVPALEGLFDKEIFYPTKKRMYTLFNILQPSNKRFLEEIGKSSQNPIEKTLYKQEFNELYNNTKVPRNVTEKIYLNSLKEEQIDKSIIDKLWISRTCVSTSDKQKTAVNNMLKAYDYINTVKTRKPKPEDLIELHKIILNDIKGESQLAGILRTPETDEIIKKIFNIKKDTKNTVNDYSESKDVVNDLNYLGQYINNNYDTLDAFTIGANIFFDLIKIHPFVNGNGRAVRLFTEQVLLSKGYRLERWPEETLYRKVYSKEQMITFLKQNSVKEPLTDKQLTSE